MRGAPSSHNFNDWRAGFAAMGTRPEFNDEIQLGHLRQLYGDSQASVIADKLSDLLNKYAGLGESETRTCHLSETDVLLITYGDTLIEPGTPPLQVLRRFHQEYLHSTFSLVHVLPFHPYSSDDGFSVVDYFSVREDLGGWQDIQDLAGQCCVMADAVINHMSSQSKWFAAYLADDPAFAEFFVECDPNEDLSTVVRPRTTPLLTQYEDAHGKSRHVWTTFSADQVDLNFGNPEVLIAVIDVLFFLISKGARLLRLDAVTFLWKEPGTSSANLPQTHALIKIMRAAISSLRDDVVVITETNVPHRENIAYFGDGHDEAHMVYNFALPPLLAYSFIGGDSQHLSQWASQLSVPSDEVCFLNFSASHDGVGVRPVEEILDDDELQLLVRAALDAEGLVSSRTLSGGEERPYELNCTFLDLISRGGEEAPTTIARFVASQAIVLAMPGVPAIYIQSLLGTRNDLGRVNQTGRARSINRSQHAYSTVQKKLADTDSLEARVFSGIANLIAVRREHEAFDPYSPFRVLDLGGQVFAIERGKTGSSATIVCIVNVTDKNVSIDVTEDIAGTDLLTNARIERGRYTLQAYAILWISAEH